MYLYRKNGCMGIMRIYCAECNKEHMVSSVGKWSSILEDFEDYMYRAASELTGKEFAIILPIVDDYESASYEYQNDYETLGIMHLESEYYDNEGFKMKFKKGENYYKYIDNLFPFISGASTECPYCGSEYVIECYANNNFESSVASLAKVLQREKDINVDIKKSVSKQIQALREKVVVPVSTSNKRDPNLQEYLTKLIGIESNIYICEQHLSEIFENSQLIRLQGELYRAYVEGAMPDRRSVLDIPPEPEYKMLGLFRRAKVREENERLEREYSKKIKPLQEAKEAFEIEWVEYISNIKELHGKAKSALDEATATKDYSRFINNVEETESAKNRLAQYEYFQDEIEECKKHLLELYELRAQMHSMNIIYPKYLEFVVLTILAEYLESGRCSELTGPYGAYNLYESELRMNLVINNLEHISEKLEDIKQNQHMTYMVFNDISNKLDSLKASTSERLDRLISAADEIERNSAISAHNTQMTAQYAHMAAVEAETSNYLRIFFDK